MHGSLFYIHVIVHVFIKAVFKYFAFAFVIEREIVHVTYPVSYPSQLYPSFYISEKYFLSNFHKHIKVIKETICEMFMIFLNKFVMYLIAHSIQSGKEIFNKKGTEQKNMLIFRWQYMKLLNLTTFC